MSARRSETLLAAAFAVWGFAIGIALIAVWNKPAPPGQLPGVATTLDFDAHGPFRWIAGLMLLPVFVPLLLRPVIRRLASGNAWARNAAIAAPLVTLWMATVRHDVRWTLVPCALVLLAATLLRHRDPGFTRRDVVLVPAFLTTLLAVLDVATNQPTDAALYIAALIVFAVRIGVAFIPSSLPPALAFLIAPLGLVLQTGFFARDQRYFGWHALALVAITPFVLRVFLKNARRATAILVFLVYPLALLSYSHAVSATTAEGKPRVSFFEDGHALGPASEYLRGERPYVDVLPAHGLFEDGFFDFLAMRAGDVTIGSRTKARELAGSLVSVALYFLAFAATGSAEGAFFAVLLGFLAGAYRGNIRLLAPLIALACIAAAVRRRRPRLFAYAAFANVIAGLVSLDFAAYTFLTLLVAVIRNRAAIRYALLGLIAGAVPLAIALAAFGIFDDFLRGTFVETLSFGPAYTLEFFTAPAAMKNLRAFPDVVGALLDRASFMYLFWCCMAIFTAVTVTRRASRRLEPMVLLGVFIVATAVSYAERHHLYFDVLAPVVIVFLILRLRGAMKWVAIAAVMAIAIPTVHLGIAGWNRRARGPLDEKWVEIRELPRARGALFYATDATAIASAHKYADLSLRNDETFFDFTNSPLLYFLLRRDMPVRWYEVAFYESEEAQREVIRRIESNPKIRAALVPASPQGRFSVDGIPNATRAPLVWEYLQAHFVPDFEEGDVVFWRRK